MAATALAVTVVAACSGGPLKTAVPKGIAYDCDKGGTAMIRYNDGGFLPDSRAVGADTLGRPAPVLRSTAELKYDDATYRLVAEYTDQGLRYRSVEPVEGKGYLIWTQRAEDPQRRLSWTRPDGARGGEDIRIGWRASATPESAFDEEGRDTDAGTDHALCRRAGRDPLPAAHPAGDHHAPQAPAKAEPHHR